MLAMGGRVYAQGQDVRLRLECLEPDAVRLAIVNTGTRDLIVPLGQSLGNARLFIMAT
jgi:hypothetical protein